VVAFAADSTKSLGQLMDWTLLDDTVGTPFVESGELDSGESLDSAMTTIIYIDMCQNNTEAATASSAGAMILIQTGTTDEDWHFLRRVTATGGTANVGDLDDTAASAQAVIPLTATGNHDDPGSVYFLHDEGTIADSALVYFGGTVSAGVSITVIDNLVNAYDADDNLYDLVDQWAIVLPPTTQGCKVLFYNRDANATYACRIRYEMVTDVE